MQTVTRDVTKGCVTHPTPYRYGPDCDKCIRSPCDHFFRSRLRTKSSVNVRKRYLISKNKKRRCQIKILTIGVTIETKNLA
jgi:hypothetical protein